MDYKHLKRGLDVIGAGFGLIATLPITVPTTVLLMVQNKGDVFFNQDRIGKDGQKFRICKFKTMTDDRDENGALLPGSQRLTRMGKFLRKHSIDELPQLWNILKGDMALVGPRPISTQTLSLQENQYNAVWMDKYLQARQQIRPGLVCYYDFRKSAETPSWDSRLASDSLYVKQASLLKDLQMVGGAMMLAVKGRESANGSCREGAHLSAYLAGVTHGNPYYTQSAYTPNS